MKKNFEPILMPSLEIVDLSENCIRACREKFGGKIKYNVTDGKSLQMIKSRSKDLVFSWDSFVHMHSSVIDSYLNDICKILKPTGYVILHHSYLAGGEEKSFSCCCCWSELGACC